MIYYNPAGSPRPRRTRLSRTARVGGAPDVRGRAVSRKSHVVTLSAVEAIVVPLEGSLDVDVDGVHHTLFETQSLGGHRRALPAPWSVASIASSGSARFARPRAVAERTHRSVTEPLSVRSEMRGAGICSRQVNDFDHRTCCRPTTSSPAKSCNPGRIGVLYPPHKHDVAGPRETRLEEIYYYEVAPSPTGTESFALQRVYSSMPGRIDATERCERATSCSSRTMATMGPASPHPVTTSTTSTSSARPPTRSARNAPGSQRRPRSRLDPRDVEHRGGRLASPFGANPDSNSNDRAAVPQ